MERRWDKVWPLWVPRTCEVHGPVGQYTRWWSEYRPQYIPLNLHGRLLTYRGAGRAHRKGGGRLLRSLASKKERGWPFSCRTHPNPRRGLFAAHRAGAVASSLKPYAEAFELEYEPKDCGTKVLFTHPCLTQKVFLRSQVRRLLKPLW